MIYFDFVERKNPEGMLGVIKHNELDILSLITLYTHLSFQLLGLDSSQTSKEYFEVGRWFSYIGEKKEAEKVYSRLAKGNEEESIKAKHELAFQLKKKKEWNQAVELWKVVVDQGEDSMQIVACVELAKIFEHRYKEIEQAMEYTEIAISKSVELTNEKDEKLLKRISRLKQKLTTQIHRPQQKKVKG